MDLVGTITELLQCCTACVSSKSRIDAYSAGTLHTKDKALFTA